MTTLWLIVAGVGGYVAAVWTWEPFHTWLVGAETKIQALRDRIKALQGKPTSTGL